MLATNGIREAAAGGAGRELAVDRAPPTWFNRGMNVLVVSPVANWIRQTARRLWSWVGPLPETAEPVGLAVDLVRSRRDLILENAVLRHQLTVLRRRGRPRLGLADRLRLLVGAAVLPGWRHAITIVQPDTVLRWHRAGFRLFWRRKSTPRRGAPLPPATVALIRDMARRNRLWGAERIRGELLKLGLRVSKRTIQKYMRAVRRRGGGQIWATFLKNHAEGTWACDFVQAYDLCFRQVYAFFIVHLASRRVEYAAATRNPTQEWTAQQLRNVLMDTAAPAFLVRDRDDKFGAVFDRVAEGAGVRVIQTAVRAPNMNAVAERFVGSLRRELLDHVLVLGDRQLGSLVRQYQAYFHAARPHQGLGQRLPAGQRPPANTNRPIEARAVLGGLHHDYRRAA